MEDRVTPGLYLEMVGEEHVDAYLAGRLPAVLRRKGVRRATWWTNVNVERTDLPRRLPEFNLLAVYELNHPFTKPARAPVGVTGRYLFHQYRRPGQGCLTGRPTIGLSLVLISPRSPDGAQALRDWADFVHIRHIAESGVPGYAMITPYENAEGTDPRFLHFYEMDCEDPEAAFKSMAPLVMSRLGGGPGTPAFDEWAHHPELRIMYVNSFRLVGEQTADG
jgi:hypothetical protein